MSQLANAVITPLIVGIVIGVTLLVLEYRTHWFANWRDNSKKMADQNFPTLGIRAKDVTSTHVEFLQTLPEVALMQKISTQKRMCCFPVNPTYKTSQKKIPRHRFGGSYHD